MASQWDQLLNDLHTFFITAANQESTATRVTAETMVIKAENYLSVLHAIINTLQASPSDAEIEHLIELLYDLVQELHHILSRWTDIELGVDLNNPCNGLKVERNYNGRCGRPKYVIKPEQLIFLRDLQFSWTQIASLYGISRRTLYNIRCNSDVAALSISNSTIISDHDLQEMILDIKTMMPETGQTMIKGILHARGIHISVTRIRDAIAIVDPVNTALRWAAPRHRRVYSVPYSNALWHIDGNHKLIRWRLVVHGGIDGFSRFIVYLSCSTNNTSDTVLQLFNNSVVEYGLPDCVRSDKGGENVKVAEHMLLHGQRNNPFLTGSSVHNQRIERLWRDTYRCVLSLYYQLFYYLEDMDKLDPDSDIDLYCLHYVYVKKINYALTLFADGWNSHAMTTEHGMTPAQMFTAGTLIPGHNLAHNVDSTISTSGNTSHLGPPSVSVPPTHSPLTMQQQDELHRLVLNHSSENEYEIDLYCAVRNFVYRHI